MLSHFSGVQLLATLWIASCWAPCPWDFPGKKTGVSCHALLQEMCPTQGLNLYLVYVFCNGRQVLYHQHLLKSPQVNIVSNTRFF